VRRSRIEIVTVAENPNLQVVSSAPEGGAHDLGLFIGGNAGKTAPYLRQLYVLAVKSFNAGERGRLVGFRQYLTIGVQIATSTKATYPLERPVETPTWKYVDGNVLWGIRKIPPKLYSLPNVNNADGLAYEYSSTPAQLFETVVAGVTTPPYGGLFPGNLLTPELGRMFDLRCRRWAYPVPCDVAFEGPCDIAFFASVQQTNPNNRTNPPSTETQDLLGQFNGNNSIPASVEGAPGYYVVTTSGTNAAIGQLLYDPGTGVGNDQVVNAYVGQSVVTTTALTGGTISFSVNVVYTWNGNAWVPNSQSIDQFLVTQGATPEDSFVQAYPGSTYFRIAGSLIFEMDSQAPTGAPKTYRRPGDADRLTRDTTETGDNTMRRSAEDSNEYKGARGGSGEKRPASPPHPSRSDLGALPVVGRLIQKYRVGILPSKKPPSLIGVGSPLPSPSYSRATTAILRDLLRWRKGEK